jgi:hypothetical protein
MSTTITDHDKARDDVRFQLAGLTRREIARAARYARYARDGQAARRDRHGNVFAEDADHADAAYREHVRIWASLHHQDEVYDPTGA